MTKPNPTWIQAIEASLPPLKYLHRIQHFTHIDSTNREAMRQLEQGADSGTVIIADQQDAGRGRLGRTWHTVEDALALSIILRPDLPPQQVAQLSLVTAVALQQALANYCQDIRIKWPNDLLIHGKKISGILTEMRATSHHVDGVVIGMGINIQAPPQGWHQDIQQSATDLQSHSQHDISRSQCAIHILRALNDWYGVYLQEGFAPIRQRWWQAHAASMQQVRVFNGTSYIEGIAIGLNDDGALLLNIEGKIQTIMAGEVLLSPESGKKTHVR